MNSYASQANKRAQTSNWVVKPSGQVGDLDAWRRKIKALCPQPQVGQIVYMERQYQDRYSNEITVEKIGYKALKIKANGEAVWQRGYYQ